MQQGTADGSGRDMLVQVGNHPTASSQNIPRAKVVSGNGDKVLDVVHNPGHDRQKGEETLVRDQ